MAAGHTPGPWHLGTGGGIEIFAADDGQVMSMQRPSVELIANALLICAAPELLQVLKDVERRVLKSAPCEDTKCPCHQELLRVRAAIAKAEGRRHG